MTQQEFNIAIPDTSCLILLSKIGELELLNKVFNTVYITEDVSKEYLNPLPQWIFIKKPINKEYQKLLEIDLDSGEASAITLSLEIENSIIILDDLKARKLANNLNFTFTGTFGVIIKAKNLGIISSTKPILDKIRKTNFHFSQSVFETVLREANEH